jgi:hypothetical protein
MGFFGEGLYNTRPLQRLVNRFEDAAKTQAGLCYFTSSRRFSRVHGATFQKSLNSPEDNVV